MPSQTSSFGDDAMLWQDEEFNRNSQEDDLSMFADIEKPSQDEPTPLQEIRPTIQIEMNWDLETWDLNSNPTNREDVYDLNTPTRFPTKFSFPASGEAEPSTDDKIPTFTNLVSRNEASPNLFTDVDTPSASPAFFSIKPEPTESSSPDENSQPDVLRQALIAASLPMALPVPVKIEDPPTPEEPKKDLPVNDRKMVGLMRKYRLTDDELHSMNPSDLKKLCGRSKQDYTTLFKYRRTCMNRFYARKSRSNKATATHNLETQLHQAQSEIRRLKQEVARRDKTIAKYEKIHGRLMQ